MVLEHEEEAKGELFYEKVRLLLFTRGPDSFCHQRTINKELAAPVGYCYARLRSGIGDGPLLWT